EEIAELIISKRPYDSLDDVREVAMEAPPPTGKSRRGAQKRPVGDKIVDDCLETWRGYEAVDALIASVEAIGRPIAGSIKEWGVDIFGASTAGELEMTEVAKLNKDSAIGTPSDGSDEVKTVSDFISTQPKNLASGVELKDYQLVGINWLNLLYSKRLSCILADEMGEYCIRCIRFCFRKC